MEKEITVIRAVIFDFGNVICRFDYDRFLDRLRRWSATPVETFNKKIFKSGAHLRYERGEMNTAQFHGLVESATGADVSREEFEDAFSNIFTPVEGTESIIRELKGKKRLGLLSNTNELHFRRCIRPMSVFPLFDSVTLSYEVGALKPEEAIYRDAMRKLSIPARECVYIDDISEYVEGAKALGMSGIRFESAKSFRADLARLGVIPI